MSVYMVLKIKINLGQSESVIFSQKQVRKQRLNVRPINSLAGKRKNKMLAMAKMYSGYNTSEARHYEYKALAVEDNERYDKLNGNDIYDMNHLANVSSISVVHKSNQREKLDSEASLFLFDGNSQVPSSDLRRLVPKMVLTNYVDRNSGLFMGLSYYHGNYIRLTKPKQGGTANLPNLASYSWDNRATSALLVSQRKGGTNSSKYDVYMALELDLG